MWKPAFRAILMIGTILESGDRLKYILLSVAAIAIVTDAESMEENQPLYLKYLQNAGHAVSDQLGYDTFLSNNT